MDARPQQTSSLVFYVNGKKVVDPDPDPETTLLQFLRTKLRLTGTKLGCGEGGCGACTVMVSACDTVSNQVRHFSVNACLAPICSLHGLAITTVEGIGSIKHGLHPVQEKIAKAHGSQCGFCTPGIVMSMYTLLRNITNPSMKDMESAFEGNLCRCTGYRPILEGFKSFTKEACALGTACCRNQTKSNGDSNSDRRTVNGSVVSTCNGDALALVNGNGFVDHQAMTNGDNQTTDLLPADSTQDPIFPPQLRTSEYDDQFLYYKGERAVWYRPTSLDQLLELKAVHPTAKLVIGNTEIGVEIKFKNMHYPVMIAPTHIPELRSVVTVGDGILFGASVTLTQLNETLNGAIDTMPEHKTGIFKAIVEMLRWFAGHQIRNVAAIGGNIMTASPISDLNPLFMAAGVMLQVASKGERRTIKMDEHFFLGYRRPAVHADEVLVSLTIPFTQENEYFYGYKQAYRREDDIAIVNAGMRVLLEGSTVRDMSMAFGGMAPTTVMPVNAMKQAIGRKWNDSLVHDMTTLLGDDLPLPAGSPGGMTEYRCTLTISFFFKFYLTVQLSLNKQQLTNQNKIPSSYHSATAQFYKETVKSTQVFEEVAQGQAVEDALGRPLHHLSACKQATGEAIYVDDIPPYKDELILAFVFSTKSHAKLLDVDPSVSLTMPGVVDFISYKDIPGHNMWGPIEHDEEFLASEKVVCMGQIIGAVIADTQTHAQRAAKAVKVKYEELQPIITIKEAIDAKSYYGDRRVIEKGDLGHGFEMSDHVIDGEVHMGGQEHFYLETHVSLAVPKHEDGEMEMFVSTQNPAETQMMVAQALDIAENKIVIRVKRMGGGFGGKETRNVIYSVPVAIAAAKHGRPVKCMLDRDEDMISSGGRHPFYGKYKVGFTKDGRILALDMDIYSNVGCSLDLSRPVIERAMFHSDGCYNIPNIRVTGRLCRTNIASNTAFRGFGGPQGNFLSETYMADISTALEMSPNKVREINMYNEGDLTHFNQPLDNCNIRRCWEECLQRSEVHRRSREVEIFNSENRWKKRGISVIPVKFGISFTAKFMNQAGALVMIYRDGSVLIAHGGTEMGQGLHTKMIQVASRALKISMSKIHISETTTNTVPNTSPTAASASSDLNGMAIKEACEILLGRIEPYRAQNPKGTWEDWVSAAFFDRVSLSVSTFYKTPDLGYDFGSNSGRPFNYFTFGSACSEVEIDCLTGDHKVLHTDIVMDVGVSLNPAIDIGQIEGAFTQGYGLMMMEQQKMSPSGYLFTRGPGAYKIPGFGDVPLEFNVSLLKSSINHRAVYSSKAIGEPPLFLAASVFFAAKDAWYTTSSRPKEPTKMTGPGEPAKYLPLPSGPASLCFDNDMFMKDSFDVDTFVMECRRRVPLETLRDDLSTYLKILRSAMIELINKDYADFVNLSSNLVGMDKAIGNLTTPLCELKDQVMTVKIAMDQAISAVEQKLKQREQIRQKKACLQRLMNIVQSVEKIERLLGIHSGEGGEIIQAQLNGPLIERVANEFNKLQFYVIKSTGLPLVERIRPRISNITSTLQISLEGHFLEGLDTGNTEILQQCLRTYALIDKIQDVENLFRKEKVRPYMEEVINEQNVKSTGGRPGLKGMFQQILDFVPQHCGILREVTTGGRMGAMESVRGYDFMVNAVWPEVVSNIEARTPSIFAPGNPNTFHDKFLVSMKFLDDFEALCGSQASVRRLREHPSYHIFINKWSLPVYYQIRFQEMAGSLETSLCTAFNNSADQDLFHLNVTLTLWRCVSRCWGEDVYLAPICHKLWKLSLQLISRYSTWLDECYKQEIEKRSLEAENQKMNTSVSMPNLTHTDRNNGAMDTSGTTGEGQITPATPPVTLGQILCLLSDVEKFSQQISSLFDETIKPKITAAGFEDTDNLKGSIQECSASLMSKLPRYREFIVEEISCQCSINLKQVNDVPRLYRRTNREVPVKPSTYIGNAFKPVSLFVQEHGNILGEKQKQEIFQEIFTRLAEQYFSVTSDVLLSVKKMEDSLKRLKRVRGTDKGAGSQGLTDDDKIRQQIILDIDSYGQQITGYGVQKEGLESYKKLQQLSAEAKSAMTTAQ